MNMLQLIQQQLRFLAKHPEMFDAQIEFQGTNQWTVGYELVIHPTQHVIRIMGKELPSEREDIDTNLG